MGEQLQAKLLRLGELNNDEEKKEILTEIGIVVKTLRNRHAEQINCTFDFGQLFAQLTSNDRYHDNANFVNSPEGAYRANRCSSEKAL